MMRRVLHAIWEILRRYFVAGILVFAPIGVTLWAIGWIITRLDRLILPSVLRIVYPSLDEPPDLPVVGAIFTVLVIILIGVIARHFFGAELVRAWEGLLGRVPVARNIYGAVKQLVEAIFASQAHDAFRRVILIEYPRKGLYALAFTTGPARGVLQEITEQRMINCFVPTTPNPTSGFYLLVPEAEIIEVDLSVEDAFKLVMSAGLVTPDANNQRAAPKPAAVPVPAVEPEPSQ